MSYVYPSPPSPHCKTRGSYHPHLDHQEFYVIAWKHKTTPPPPNEKKITPKGHPSYTPRLPKRKAKKKNLRKPYWYTGLLSNVNLSEFRIVAMLKHTPTSTTSRSNLRSDFGSQGGIRSLNSSVVCFFTLIKFLGYSLIEDIRQVNTWRCKNEVINSFYFQPCRIYHNLCKYYENGLPKFIHQWRPNDHCCKKRSKKQENYLHSYTIKCGQQNDVHLWTTLEWI